MDSGSDITLTIRGPKFALSLSVVGYAYPVAQTADSADLLDGVVNVESKAFGECRLEQPFFMAARGCERFSGEVDRLLAKTSNQAVLTDAEGRMEIALSRRVVVSRAPGEPSYECAGRVTQGAGATVLFERIVVDSDVIRELSSALHRLGLLYPSRYEGYESGA